MKLWRSKGWIWNYQPKNDPELDINVYNFVSWLFSIYRNDLRISTAGRQVKSHVLIYVLIYLHVFIYMYLFMYLFIYMYLYTCTYLFMYLWPVSNPPIVPATPYYSNKYLIFKGQNHRIFPKTIRNLKFAFLKMFCMLKDSKSKNVLHAG